MQFDESLGSNGEGSALIGPLKEETHEESGKSESLDPALTPRLGNVINLKGRNGVWQ